MKHLLFIACIVLGMGACKHEPAYTIRGTIDQPEFEGKTVYLTIGGKFRGGLAPGEELKIDSTVVSGGKYSFEGKVLRPECASIRVNPYDFYQTHWIQLALDNADITVHTDAEGWTTVSGTPDNDQYQRMLEERRESDSKQDALIKQMKEAEAAGTLTPEQEEQWSDERMRYYDEGNDITYRHVKENINNPAFWDDIHNAAIMRSVEEQKALIAGADERVQGLKSVQDIREWVAVLERTAVGQPFTDFRMSDPDGKEVALSDYVGKEKYVLVDFWASWCGPCREELPNVKAAYEKYKGKGLDIVGVSLDSNHDSWLKAIRELDLPWHHLSDLKGWDCEGSQLYGVMGIPHTVLIDKNGTIIARDLHGEGLQEKLAELFQ